MEFVLHLGQALVLKELDQSLEFGLRLRVVGRRIVGVRVEEHGTKVPAVAAKRSNRSLSPNRSPPNVARLHCTLSPCAETSPPCGVLSPRSPMLRSAPPPSSTCVRSAACPNRVRPPRTPTAQPSKPSRRPPPRCSPTFPHAGNPRATTPHCAGWGSSHLERFDQRIVALLLVVHLDRRVVAGF